MDNENTGTPAVFENQNASALSLIMNGAAFDRVMILADLMSSGKTSIPEHLRGNKADCAAIAMQALRWGADPFVVAQKPHLVGGKLGYEAQLVIAVLQNSGMVKGLPKYEYRGEGEQLECRVGFNVPGESQMIFNEFLMLSDVKIRNSPLWKSNIKQQLGYLQIGRAHV